MTEDKQKLVQLIELQEKLSYELQSAQNRLNYASHKVKSVEDSLYHARGVLKDQTPEPAFQTAGGRREKNQNPKVLNYAVSDDNNLSMKFATNYQSKALTGHRSKQSEFGDYSLL